MEKVEFKFSKSKYKDEKTNARDAIIIFILMSIAIPLTLFLKHWQFSLPIGIFLGVLVSVQRWNRYKKVIELLKLNRLYIDSEEMEFIYPGGKTIIEINHPKLIHLNFKNKALKSILIVLNDKTKIFMDGYENLDQMVDIFKQKINENQIKKHQWFHKTY